MTDHRTPLNFPNQVEQKNFNPVPPPPPNISGTKCYRYSAHSGKCRVSQPSERVCCVQLSHILRLSISERVQYN